MTSKRKRLEDSPTIKDEQITLLKIKMSLSAKMMQLIGRMETETRYLYKIISDNQNTRMDIRDSALAIRSIMSQITT